MGQYFKAVNPDRKETIALDGAMKVLERLTNATAMTQLSVLLYDHDAPEEYYDYYGRWAGDEVRLIGDYAESGLYDAPRPTIEVAPLSNPSLIEVDTETSTAPDRWSVTEDWTVTLDHGRSPILKGTWRGRRSGHKMPGPEHPDSELTVGTYVELRTKDDDRLEADTYGVVMDIENDWTDITDDVETEMELLVEREEIEQDGQALLPKQVLRADT